MAAKNLAQTFGVSYPPLIEPVPNVNMMFPVPPRIAQAIRFLNFGFEVEVENTTAILDTELWCTKEDGSLRNNGMEYVARLGTAVGHFDLLMSELEEHVAKERKRHNNPQLYDFSERTSIHIHLDITRFTEEMLENLLILYTLYEEPLFEFCAPNRKHNIFCIPLRESTVMEVANARQANIWRIVERFVKYSAINLACANKLGTVEFRHHHGCLERSNLREWIYVLALLRYYAERISNAELRDRIYRLKTESAYEVLTRDIFHGYAGVVMLRTNPKTMDLAVSDAKCFFTGDC